MKPSTIPLALALALAVTLAGCAPSATTSGATGPTMRVEAHLDTFPPLLASRADCERMIALANEPRTRENSKEWREITSDRSPGFVTDEDSVVVLETPTPSVARVRVVENGREGWLPREWLAPIR